MEKRGREATGLLEELTTLNLDHSACCIRLDSLRQLRKKNSQAYHDALVEQPRAHGHADLLDKIKKNKKDIAAATAALATIVKEQRRVQESLPNLLHESVPEGRGSENNVFIACGGYEGTCLAELPSGMPECALPHWEIAKKLGILAFEEGAKVTGAGFTFCVGKGATLVRGMINYFLQKALEEGYKEIHPPLLINETAGFGTGQLPDKDGQMYRLADLPYYLVPTAEVPLTNFYAKKIFEENTLPVRLVSYTPCFRREAGSWGANTRGLNRLHQFDKVEIVEICTPEQSYERLEKMASYVGTLLDSLALPYRRVLLCSGDTGFCSAKTYDFEVYSSAQKKWLEVSSVSNFESFQAERMQLKYRNKAGKKECLHTLNGSALAIPRVLACMLENCQKDNRVAIPKVLEAFTGFGSIP